MFKRLCTNVGNKSEMPRSLYSIFSSNPREYLQGPQVNVITQGWIFIFGWIIPLRCATGQYTLLFKSLGLMRFV